SPRGPPHPSHEAAAEERLGVAVLIVGQNFIENEALHRSDGTAGGNVIGINQWFGAEGPSTTAVLPINPARTFVSAPPLLRLARKRSNMLVGATDMAA